MSTNVATIPQGKQSLVAKFAGKYSIDPDKLLPILKATAFRQKDGDVTNEQMAALLVVADQFGLNPFTKEIFAFPDKGGIVPVVGVDGWSRIINDHKAFDGMDFEQDDLSCTCIIYRKDRTHPIKVTEWMAECKKSTGPWSSHPRRMLRHKAMIQCARIAFSYGGIYDEDEAERIIERDMGAAQVVEKEPAGLPAYSQEKFDKNLPQWTELIITGSRTAAEIIATVSSRTFLSDEQKAAITAIKAPVPDADFVADMEKAERQPGEDA